ncbi:hypothetical protein [Jeotgalibacillus salarius]|uniref:Uncharacterized protein n=1 Tax=Jeotgalibacillus salarius TaxID=546023 RepID=A0A4Y8LEK7_9BACL|nr:hypothetical protein [Jeotgalibacillus salarius]TFE00629.1 hypothetical protein E2626_11690 [Jeotgalibacillus salarius]
MKKFFFSLLGGIFFGGIISFFLMDYRDTGYELGNYYGITSKTVKELDFNFIFNVGIIIIGVSILIFVIWTYIEKKFINV